MYIDIDKSLIPYRFDIELAGELFTMEVNYNSRFSFFTVGIEKDGEILVANEKLMLNKPLFSTFTDLRLPKVYIIPFDEEGVEDRITYDNLGKTVFLFVGENYE